MPIEPNKPLKNCKFCGKDYANLGLHIINAHPSVMQKLDESENIPQITPNTPQFGANKPQIGSINEMIREKLDTMLNIKIIEMLSKSQETSIQDIQKIVNPTPPTSLQDVKALHDMIYSEKKEIPEETGNQWLELINNALPIVGQMLPQRKEEMKNNDTERARTEERSPTILRPISQEIARDTTEPRSIGEEPRTIVSIEQPNN